MKGNRNTKTKTRMISLILTLVLIGSASFSYAVSNAGGLSTAAGRGKYASGIALPAAAMDMDFSSLPGKETANMEQQEGVTVRISEPEYPGVIHVTKRLPEEELPGDEEETISLFRLQRIAEDGEILNTFYQKLVWEDGTYLVDESGYLAVEATFTNLPDGIYRLSEIGGGNYDFSRAGRVSANGAADGNAAVFTIGTQDDGTSVFVGSAVFVQETKGYTYKIQDNDALRISL